MTLNGQRTMVLMYRKSNQSRDMIPKVIHYCWFGRNPLPADAIKCIKSWERFLPNYTIKEWNEDNFDVNMISYSKEAYSAKKYAFVSDYARFWILYNYGGLYFDTDVEVIKPIDDIIARGNFMGYECSLQGDDNNGNKAVAPGLGLGVNPGLGLGVNPGLGIIKDILINYENCHFLIDGKQNTSKTIVNFTTEVFEKAGITKFTEDIDFSSGVYLYSPEYFCPLDHHTGLLNITSKSRTIHHYSASWKTNAEKRKIALLRFLGPRVTNALVAIKKRIIKV